MSNIIDGKGRGYKAGVSSKNRLLGSVESNLTGHFVSVEDGLAFNINSIDSSADAGDYICDLKNTSKTNVLFIDLVRVSAANAALFKIFEVTGTAAGSSAITPKNLNLSSGKSAEATARGDGAITGLTADGIIANVRTSAGTSAAVPFDDILTLGTDDAIAIEYDTGTTGAAEVLIRCFYQAIEDIA